MGAVEIVEGTARLMEPRLLLPLQHCLLHLHSTPGVLVRQPYAMHPGASVDVVAAVAYQVAMVVTAGTRRLRPS